MIIQFRKLDYRMFAKLYFQDFLVYGDTTEGEHHLGINADTEWKIWNKYGDI
jgi:hypothetical protein